jgi:3'(2'), 5'-bisphosphate nucleotidase
MLSFIMLLSEELQRLFPSIPLVAEEDSASLRRCSVDDDSCDILIDSIFRAVADKASNNDSPLTHAIDRGGKEAVSFDSNPATYWVNSKLCSCIIYHKLASFIYFDVVF